VKDSRLGGIALILGAIASVATMVFHPMHFRAIASAEAITHQVRVLLAVHALGLLSVPALVFGFVGLTGCIGWERPGSLFALIAYCLSAVAIMFAGIADGLINAALIQKILSADEAARGLLRAALEYNFELNQACAKVFVFGTALAIISWSLHRVPNAHASLLDAVLPSPGHRPSVADVAVARRRNAGTASSPKATMSTR
jgi:hypothetical protein